MCGEKGKGCCGVSCGCAVSWVAKILLVVGGLNWGLVGAGMLMGGDKYAWNLVTIIFGSLPWLEALVYVLVGISALVLVVGCRCKKCKACNSCNVNTETANTPGQQM